MRNHGAGNTKNRRGAGGRGGKGMAGAEKHRWTWTVKYDPQHFGVHGFAPIPRSRPEPINLHDINILVVKSALVKGADGLYAVNLPGHKVLGSGQLEFPVAVKAASFSEGAKKKIAAAGGKIVE